ncbi:glucose-6-phosphate 1-dehydrogenase [Solimonas aquatica]|uniref:Glucose-6-phosphate 1-dehydrogenase n=1 Tax=Solimonas aquatica TaxID=489703 RepID=A0A1H9AQL4_9GAMM|nr:glucose-6-phosphate dehydrogenase [Solimonas aquatica]SEP79066.1 glucose-6-phosphate 1-dehydrogenase [Solimonas aquatica]
MALPAFDFVLFGGGGDLAMRKLIPALYYRHRDSPDAQGWRVIAIGREALNDEQYRQRAEQHCRQYLPAADFSEAAWQRFVPCLEYQRLDGTVPDDYAALAQRLQDPQRVRVFYLATAPSLFTAICGNLGAAGLVTPNARVVLEKPLGRDRASAQRINEDVGRVFAEEQIFRIDHYLGKETVQNLIALRFGNLLFEPLWNRAWVRDVQITIAETVGVEGRGEFYDNAGALRDMVQNHLLQLLCIVAMEPPANIEADTMRDEKLKVLRSLRPLSTDDVATRVVRGQYRAGAIAGKPVPGYLEEPGIPAQSRTETFVAIRAELDNWRWSGVPFFLRTGKRMSERLAEIVVNFRAVPHPILPNVAGSAAANRLVISLQPNEGLRLDLMAKVPGESMQIQPIPLDVAFAETYHMRPWDAYERLIMDVIRGRLTLFMRRDELDAAWAWVEPIMQAWEKQPLPPKSYPAGTWGPTASSALLARDGLAWHEES